MSSKTKTTAMKEEAKPARVPKVRFLEFRGTKGWENKLIGPYLEDCSGRVPPDTELPVYSSTREGLKRQDAYFDGRVLQNKNEYGLVPPGCLVYRHMSDDGLFKFNINETGGDIAVSKEYPVFSTKALNPVFLLAKLNDGLDFKNFALSQKAGGTRTRLYFSRLCEWRTLLPSPAEQQKIAECLSSVDELMAAQARKVEVLKTHKKGLMQQLFPREGETQPRLRFPEFRNAGEWEEVSLGDIAEIKLGKMLDKQKHTTGQLLPYLNNLAVRWNEVNTSNLPQMYFNDRELDRFGLRAGDVVVCEGGEPGRAAVWDGSLPDLKFQKAIHRVRFNVPFEPTILVLHLENLAGTIQFEMLFTGGGIKHLTGETFARLKVPLIPHAEQQRIADCLTSLDALITAETQKIESLKTHKKGLMQQLFPVPEETADL
jgi:type I restriction enzyme S subunit